jgi:hypothetical protein
LAGIFHSTELCAGVRNKMGGGGMDYYDVTRQLRLGNEHVPDPREIEKIELAKKALAEAKAELAALRGKPESGAAGTEGPPKLTLARQKVTKLQEQLLALTDPAAQGQAALGVREAKTVGDTEIRIRGEAEKLGPVAPRGFLSVVDVPQAPKINPNQSGRLELAEWLTHPRNPLSSRVMVNRVWRHLFGRGLVSSVDNFGVTGDVPSHPELLDYLAAQFIQGRWSVKALIRSVVLSRAYRLSSGERVSRVAESADPGNRLIRRHLPRRLDAEEIRDAMLLAAGTLAPARSLASPAKDMKVMELQNNGPEATRLEKEGRASRHRSVYLPLLRGLVPHALEVFDFAEQGFVTGSRDTTTVATQALYLLNDPFVRQQSRALAERLLRRADLEDSERVRSAYRWTLSREAMAKEIDRAESYLREYEDALHTSIGSATAPDAKASAWASFCQVLFGSAEFRYVP